MYSVSLRSIETARADLERMLSSPQVVWYAPPGAPATWSRAFAMRLRNAMHSAEHNSKLHSHVARYAHLFATTTIKVINERTVAAVANGKVVGEPTSTADLPVAEAVRAPSAPAGPLDSILATYQTRRLSSAHIRIADCTLTPAELGHLAHVLAADDWMVMLAFDGALTLAPDDPLVPADAKVTPVALTFPET